MDTSPFRIPSCFPQVAPSKLDVPAKPRGRPPIVREDVDVPVSDALTEVAQEIVSAPPAAPPAPAVEQDDDEIRDTVGMRRFLLKQMQRAARGELKPEAAKTVVSIAQQVYNATKLELEAARLLKQGNTLPVVEFVDSQK